MRQNQTSSTIQPIASGISEILALASDIDDFQASVIWAVGLRCLERRQLYVCLKQELCGYVFWTAGMQAGSTSSADASSHHITFQLAVFC
jgi:hypothetical protein